MKRERGRRRRSWMTSDAPSTRPMLSPPDRRSLAPDRCTGARDLRRSDVSSRTAIPPDVNPRSVDWRSHRTPTAKISAIGRSVTHPGRRPVSDNCADCFHVQHLTDRTNERGARSCEICCVSNDSVARKDAKAVNDRRRNIAPRYRARLPLSCAPLPPPSVPGIAHSRGAQSTTILVLARSYTSLWPAWLVPPTPSVTIR